MELVTTCQLIYGIPSLSLMIFFFFLPIFERKTLKNPFYHLVQIDLFVNITCYLNTWVALRLEKEQFGMEFLVFLEKWIPGVITAACFMTVVYFHLQNVTGLALAFYRLTSVHFFNSEYYWSRLYPLVPVIGIAYSFMVLAPWWATGELVTRAVLVDGTIQKQLNMRALILLCSFDPIFAVFYFLLVMLIGVWTTTVVLNRWKKSNSQRHVDFIKKMTRVVYCNSFLMSGNLLFLIVFSVLILVSPYRSTAFKYQTLVVTFTSDLFTLAMPYILLIFDSNIRRKFGIESSERSNQYSIKTVSNAPQN